MKIKDAEFIEKQLRDKITHKTGMEFKKNHWWIEQIETLLNCYPILRKFYHQKMTLEELEGLVKRLSQCLDMQYSEEDDLIFFDLTSMDTFISLKEMFILVLLALLTDKSHVHFKFNKALFDDIKISDTDAFDYLCDNSYLITNIVKKTYHFTLSVAAMLSFDYNNQDKILSSLKSIQQQYKKDLSLTAYLKYKKIAQNINTNSKLKMQSSSIKINL